MSRVSMRGFEVSRGHQKNTETQREHIINNLKAKI